MSRVAVLIDGFNLYHALDKLEDAKDKSRYHKYKWLSLTNLARCFISKTDTLEAVYYFTTFSFWDAGKVARHRTFIRAQELEGVHVIYGEFKRKQKFCLLCRQYFPTVEEKQTDVNIAIHLLHLAVKNSFDKAIIISGDTDLLPAIKAVKASFPTKQVGVVVPIGKRSENLKRQADFSLKMKEQHLSTSRLPDTITLPNGKTLSCPSRWLETPFSEYPSDKPAEQLRMHPQYHLVSLRCGHGLTLTFMYTVQDKLRTHKVDAINQALVRLHRVSGGADLWTLVEVKAGSAMLYNESTIPSVVTHINDAMTNLGLSLEDAAIQVARLDGHL
ncbi:MAG TPA: NYN domain-containing protein [Pyrinomonadaceae bacterium]|nr:NYN domain-containing protein [Pyrinomonadaceae bacterium]